MQFNPRAISHKQRDLDTILKHEGLLCGVLDRRFAVGYSWRVIPRCWEPGGGATLIEVTEADRRTLLKVKTRHVTVESKLESEPVYSELPSLRNEYEFLQTIANADVPSVRFYDEVNDFCFLAVEWLEPFPKFLARADCAQLLTVWENLEAIVRRLYNRGIVHTDIHEANFCMRGDQPVLVDFEEARSLPQEVPFEKSLDVIGRNQYGDVGNFPSGHGCVEGLTSLNRLREVFKFHLRRKLPSLIAKCKFDHECPFNLDRQQAPDERVYQSILLEGMEISGQRGGDDPRPELLCQMLKILSCTRAKIRYVDIGSNLGIFCLAAAKQPFVEASIGLEAFAPYVHAARVLAFLIDAHRACFERFVGGEDNLAPVVGRVDCVSMLSVYHHVANKDRLLTQLADLKPAYLLAEMATQDRFYPERGSLERELNFICDRLQYTHMQKIAESPDYRRPFYLFTDEPINEADQASVRALFVPAAKAASAWGRWARRLRHPVHTLHNAMHRLRRAASNAVERDQGSNRIRLYDRYCLAIDWVRTNRIAGQGVRITHLQDEVYPEVTGYFIPTLMSWGEHSLTAEWARWLLTIQCSNGAWNGPGGKIPYTFDTGQILKGLLAIEPRMPEVRSAVERGCDWLLTQIDNTGAMHTPDTTQWKLPGDRMVPEAIHLYCLEPLRNAAERYDQPRWRQAADRVLAHYLAKPELTRFDTLSHFHAYILEALVDLGERDRAREGLAEVERHALKKGQFPAYRDVNWLCSTGLFQYAIVGYKLGEKPLADAAFAAACDLQNPSGGFYGGYGPGASYFADREISWAIKYFLDALRLKIAADFDTNVSIFSDDIDFDDGRFCLVRRVFDELTPHRILDAGCGKGRFLARLRESGSEVELTGLDLSSMMLTWLPSGITPLHASLLDIPSPDAHYDFVFSVEALEHAIAVEQAVAELVRVVAWGGCLLIIDKNFANLGALRIADWEQWFEADEITAILERAGCDVRVERGISHAGESGDDGLFLGWVAYKRPTLSGENNKQKESPFLDNLNRLR